MRIINKAGITIVASLTAFLCIGLLSSPANAATNASAKVCAYNQAGQAEANALLVSWTYTSSGWKRYATANAGTYGCGWVAVPTNSTSAVQVYREPAVGTGNYTEGQWCAMEMAVPYDNGYTPNKYVPSGTGGINFGTAHTTMSWVACQ